MVFPGQGSQAVGMQADLAASYPVVQQTYEQASEILNYDLWALVQGGPADKLAETVVTQPAMLTAGIAAYRAWRAAGGPVPLQFAGHSLGEYSALVAAESVSFEDAMAVVIRRAELMQGAVPAGVGAMAAIIGLDDAGVIAACDEASSIGIAEPVNFNSPGQVVIAGHKEAVDNAIAHCKAAGARLAMPLPVSVPSHSSLMIGAGEALTEALAAADFCTPAIRVLAATDGKAYGDGDDIRARLSRQVYSPVHWVTTVTAMIDGGATAFVECGPGKVLAGLCRRINKSVPVLAVDTNEGLQKALTA
ncbi:MAG: ACP S-malonyltransferase [Gammaproteobacteria bacterium]|nr:ACP S-malonyltransferase [Gammaproteobacteria bacterium]MDH5239850.1 ACP S-malonyltransferase [Gammaproteobacteria bacterium]MDH5583194.1 ACP S-malonyltransferase [Gammaproteobacteria bacterium]